MCKNLVEKGNLDKPLILYNRTEKRAKDLSETLGGDKTKVTTSISEAVKHTDIIFMCLGEDPSVNSVVDAILADKVKGRLIVDCSTVHPDTTNALEKKITESGNEFVGMPGLSFPLSPDLAMLILSKFLEHHPWQMPAP
jgi:3-hydroxyisobutyrate dehydrogenase-like beta-hydroxyacid dehydrogenase